MIDGTLAVGFFSVLVFMTQRLLWPLTRLGETFDLYQRAMASTRRILGSARRRAARSWRAPRRSEGPVAGAVRFEDVRFSYSSGPEVLHGLDIDMPAGETHAVVGLTGAGKSTIVKLLLRLYEPTAGRVTVDGVDVRELSFAELRGAIGLVSQDVFLFDGTVRENIAYGDPDAPDERVEEAARLAEAHEFITALPDGYDTLVGERGQKLSGGQRQRLSIARAIVRGTPRSWFWTRRHRRWTTRPRRRSRGPWRRCLGGADDAGYRAPVEHGPARRSNPCAGGRAGPGGGDARRAGPGRRALRRVVAGSDGGGRRRFLTPQTFGGIRVKPEAGHRPSRALAKRTNVRAILTGCALVWVQPVRRIGRGGAARAPGAGARRGTALGAGARGRRQPG